MRSFYCKYRHVIFQFTLKYWAIDKFRLFVVEYLKELILSIKKIRIPIVFSRVLYFVEFTRILFLNSKRYQM